MGNFFSQDQKASKMIFVIALLCPALAMAHSDEGPGECIPGVSNEVLLCKCSENTVLGEKVWDATMMCSSQTAMRGINNFALNRDAEDETECHSFDELESYGADYVDDVGCGLMAMEWMDDTGSWNWTQVKDDLKSLPIHHFRIHHCVKHKVKEYKKSGLNWNTCKSTFTADQQEYINGFLKDMARIECIHDKLTKGCCKYLTSSPSTGTGTGTGSATGSGTDSGTGSTGSGTDSTGSGTDSTGSGTDSGTGSTGSGTD